jgi:hypothetical protein
MYIQLNYYSKTPNGNVLTTLPDFFYFSPNEKVALTEDNAEEFGYIKLENRIENIVEAHIDDTLKTYKWSSLGNCSAFAIVGTSMFNQEALDLIVFADSVWSYAIGKQNEYLANTLEYDEETFTLGLPTYGTT